MSELMERLIDIALGVVLLLTLVAGAMIAALIIFTTGWGMLSLLESALA